MIGETISHYRIIERLGAGGMGEVYKAEDLRLHRPVALKLIFDNGEQNEQSEQVRARFLREARAASALNHPNIATIYEIDEIVRDGSRYSFIVMEYVPGRTLKDVGRDFTLAEDLEVISQIADALAEAHERGIVHRDIKPSNIIVTEHTRVKILDFGVAKYNPLPNEDAVTASLFHTDLMKTSPGTVIGTFAYMSPEQALGKEVDGRSDIFSLGVMFYELIAGRPPFTGSSTLAVVDAILHADPLPVTMFNFRATPDLERVVHRMLEKDRSRRYQKMLDVINDLEAVQRGMPIEVDLYETNIGSTAPLGSSVNLGTTTFKNRQGKSLAVMSFSNITKNTADDWIGTGIAETVTADLKKIEGITVIGRERVYEVLRHWSVDQDAEIDETLATSVGREVGARWIVCGGYQKIGEMLRITARFVEVETGEVIKTVKIDGQMKEIFDLQDKIVYELSRDLDLSLRSGEREEIEQKETNVVEAYEAFVKADMALDKGSPDKIEEAIQLFEQAIKLDPDYAHAYAGVGYAVALKGQFLSKPEFFERAVECFQKAIELNPLLADGYSGLGFTFVAMGRDDDAIGALRRVLSFAPHDVYAHSTLGRAYMIGKGMFREAAAEYKLTLKLNPKAGWVAQQLALCCSYLGDYECGMEAARQAIEAQEKYISGQTGMQIIGSFVRLAHIYNLQGRYDDAISECYRELVFLRQSNHALKERTMIEVNQKLISAYVRQDNPEDARRVFDQLIKSFETRLAAGSDDPFTRYYVACACAMMGEKERALEHLQKAVEGRPNFNIARAKVEIDFEGLRNDERFLALVNH
ncbi:MAG: tetratricopeptide repeat-containing serine/threonine-protein kinase [Acidobacteria bacterium]|nr:tetratricopeptide repeat-containing serine/threonine-protein kinase [Acidobacteriota bacterium]